MRICIALVLLLAVFPLSSVQAGSIPPDSDGWCEFDSWVDAMNAGWFVECGITYQLIVDEDCCVGERSVGAMTLSSGWDKSFGFETSRSLAGVTDLVFAHKASWDEFDFMVRIFMTCSPAEIAAGFDQKSVAWEFPTSTSWATFNRSLASGTWSWRNSDSGMWLPSGGDTQPTELVSVVWTYWNLFGVQAGDWMLTDNLHLVTDSTPVDETSWSAAKQLF